MSLVLELLFGSRENELTMELTIIPENPRTLLPIVVDVTQVPASEALKVTVKPVDQANRHVKPFSVSVSLYAPGHYHGEFWLENAGGYEVTAKTGTEIKSVTLSLEEQTFLPFFDEIGFFSLLFFVMAIGVYLWSKYAHKTA